MYKNKEPAATVGSLREKVMMESLVAFIEKIITSPDPKGFLKNIQTKFLSYLVYGVSLAHAWHVI